jgi:hypothetical protein
MNRLFLVYTGSKVNESLLLAAQFMSRPTGPALVFGLSSSAGWLLLGDIYTYSCSLFSPSFKTYNVQF